MALPQDGQNANGLTKVTEIPTGKELIFIDPTTNEGGIITLEDLTTQILNKLTSKIFTLDQGNMTLLQALNQLNSNKTKILQQIKTGIVVNVIAGQYKGGSLLVFGRKNPNGVVAFFVSYFRNESSDNLVAEIVPLDGQKYTAVCDNAKITITGGNLMMYSRIAALSGDGFVHSSVEGL